MSWIAILKIAYLILIVATVVALVKDNQEPERTLVWLLLIVCVPILGWVVYFLIGKDYRRQRIIGDTERQQLEACRDSVWGTYQVKHVDNPFDHVASLLRQANASPVWSHNRVGFFTDFTTMFQSLKHDIAEATQYIHIQFFKIENDNVGRELSELLIAKVAQGVEVRLMYDSAANFAISRRFYRHMRQGGVQVVPFLRLRDSVLARTANCRNHRKVVAIDGKVGYTGGMNVAERYSTGIHTGIWRDTHLRLVGPAVSQLQMAFLSDWYYATHQLLAERRYFDVTTPSTTSPVSKPVQIVTAGPFDRWHTVMQGMVQAIAQSRHYVYLQSPYFMPSTSVLQALCNAALAGVDVRVMLPERPDKGMMVHWASHSYFQEAMAAGVHIYLYRKGYMHAKTLVCDDSFATVGSTNIDLRSFETDFEINAFFYDAEVANLLRQIFLNDQQDCTEVDPRQWSQRRTADKIRESLSRLFVPLL